MTPLSRYLAESTWRLFSQRSRAHGDGPQVRSAPRKSVSRLARISHRRSSRGRRDAAV